MSFRINANCLVLLAISVLCLNSTALDKEALRLVGLSDHVGLAGNNYRAMHRMEIAQAITEAEQAGFEVISSDLLRNQQDPDNRDILNPRLARNTDRFLLKLQKPE